MIRNRYDIFNSLAKDFPDGDQFWLLYCQKTSGYPFGAMTPRKSSHLPIFDKVKKLTMKLNTYS